MTFTRDGPEDEKPTARRFGFVPGHDCKPRRRLFELLRSQGLQANQQLVFMSDGGESVRTVQTYLSPHAEHLLDWFHLTMRLTVLGQSAKGLPARATLPADALGAAEDVQRGLERIKHYLWHGNLFQALKAIDGVELDLECADTATAGKLLRGIHELRGYVERNERSIPNDGERYRHGEPISTAMAESTVNQVVSRRFVKRQQMQWTRRGAHLLLQTRTQVLDGELETTFRGWYPRFRPGPVEHPGRAAA